MCAMVRLPLRRKPRRQSSQKNSPNRCRPFRSPTRTGISRQWSMLPPAWPATSFAAGAATRLIQLELAVAVCALVEIVPPNDSYDAGMNGLQERDIVFVVVGWIVICTGLFEAGLAVGRRRIVPPAVVAAVLVLSGVIIVAAAIRQCLKDA